VDGHYTVPFDEVGHINMNCMDSITQRSNKHTKKRPLYCKDTAHLSKAFGEGYEFALFVCSFLFYQDN